MTGTAPASATKPHPGHGSVHGPGRLDQACRASWGPSLVGRPRPPPPAHEGGREGPGWRDDQGHGRWGSRPVHRARSGRALCQEIIPRHGHTAWRCGPACTPGSRAQSRRRRRPRGSPGRADHGSRPTRRDPRLRYRSRLGHRQSSFASRTAKTPAQGCPRQMTIQSRTSSADDLGFCRQSLAEALERGERRSWRPRRRREAGPGAEGAESLRRREAASGRLVRYLLAGQEVAVCRERRCVGDIAPGFDRAMWLALCSAGAFSRLERRALLAMVEPARESSAPCSKIQERMNAQSECNRRR